MGLVVGLGLVVESLVVGGAGMVVVVAVMGLELGLELSVVGFISQLVIS